MPTVDCHQTGPDRYGVTYLLGSKAYLQAFY